MDVLGVCPNGVIRFAKFGKNETNRTDAKGLTSWHGPCC